jgi:hypothetical protein
MEWTLTIEGQNMVGHVQRAEFWIKEGFDRLFASEISGTLFLMATKK